MTTNTAVIWWYSKISKCIHCQKLIEIPNLYKCDNCGKLVCTDCAQYVAIYNVAKNKYDGRRVCNNCIPATSH